MRPALLVTTPRIRGECWLAGTKSQVDPSEAKLIQRALSGQEEAFRELVRPLRTLMAVQAILKNEAAELITPPSFD
jgi:hypothetical protein